MTAATKHSFGPNAGKKAKGAGHPVMFGYPKSSLHFEPFSDGGGILSALWNGPTEKWNQLVANQWTKKKCCICVQEAW